MEDVKIKISVFWLIGELVAIAGNLLELYETGFIRDSLQENWRECR
jgi:hypothetical protein